MKASPSSISMSGAALFAGAAACALQQEGGYVAASWVCGPAASEPVWIFTAAALAMLAIGAWASWQSWRRLPEVSQGSDLVRPRRFLSLVALWSALLFLFAVLLQAGAALFLPGCLG